GGRGERPGVGRRHRPAQGVHQPADGGRVRGRVGQGRVGREPQGELVVVVVGGGPGDRPRRRGESEGERGGVDGLVQRRGDRRDRGDAGGAGGRGRAGHRRGRDEHAGGERPAERAGHRVALGVGRAADGRGVG